MQISLRIETRDPPQGGLSVAGAGEVAFSGWIELLALLENAVATAGPPRQIAYIDEQSERGRHAD